MLVLFASLRFDSMRITLLAWLLVSGFAVADEAGWVTKDGQPIPNSDAMKSIDGFGGWLMVTPDTDWLEKWLTPKDDTPSYTEAEQVSIGETVTILAFFINPRLNEDGEAKIACAVRIVRPNGVTSVEERHECVSAVLPGDRRNVRLSPTYIEFVGEETDPLGDWIIEYTISDVLRGVDIPLRASFELIE